MHSPRDTQRIVVRILATPATVFGAALLVCLSAVPVEAFDDTVVERWQNILILAFYTGFVLLATTLLWSLGLRAWVPADLPLWLIALVALPSFGDELDVEGAGVAALVVLGVLLFVGMVVRLILFHVGHYRREHG